MKNNTATVGKKAKPIFSFYRAHKNMPVMDAKDPYPKGEPIYVQYAEIDYQNEATVKHGISFDLEIYATEIVTKPIAAIYDGKIEKAFGSMAACVNHFRACPNTIKKCASSPFSKDKIRGYKLEYITKEVFNDLLNFKTEL